MAARVKTQGRDRDTGQFAFEGNWNRVCVCGHELGYHAAESPHDCFNSDRLNIGSIGGLDAKRFPPTDCRCKKFRLSKRKENRAGATKKEWAKPASDRKSG